MKSKRIQTKKQKPCTCDANAESVFSCKRHKPKLPTIEQINMPDHEGQTVHTIIGDHILLVKLEYDPDRENPCTEMDGVGTIRSLSRSHINKIDIDRARELLKSDEDVIPLSYFEHGNSLWMAMDSPAPAGVEFQWDGVKFAGIWIPDKSVRESYQGQDGLSRRDWMVKQAASACELYTQWINGDVYGYIIKLYKLRKENDEPYTELSDYRLQTPLFDDSCWGYYGWDDAREQTLYAAKYALEKLGYGKRAVAKIMEASK